jgi:hypothetical protein
MNEFQIQLIQKIGYSRICVELDRGLIAAPIPR